MKKKIKAIIAVLLSFLLAMSFFVIIISLFLQHTILNIDFYQSVTQSPAYQFHLKQSINNELVTKSNFTAIPLEHLQAGLDEKLIDQIVENHIKNTTAFLNYEPEFTPIVYPDEKFYEPLVQFIEEHGRTENYEPTDEQYELLADVASDSARMIERHASIINLDLVKDISAFQRLHRAIHDASLLFVPSLLAFLVAAGIIALMFRRDWRSTLTYTLTSLWIAGAMLAVPAIVTDIYALPRRLAIETPYLKYAIDAWLTSANRYILIWGVAILVLSTLGLTLSYFSQKHLKRKRKKR